jgi:chromosome segregation ATPase
MIVEKVTEDIALQIAADSSQENLQSCLGRIRGNQEALAAAQAQMDKALYDLLRAREFVEAMQEANQDLEARVYLLLGAYDA